MFDYTVSKSHIRFERMLTEQYELCVLGNSRGVNSLSESRFEEKYLLETMNLSYNGLLKSEILFLAEHIRDSTVVFVEATSFLWDSTSYRDGTLRFNVFSHLRQSTRRFRLLDFNNELFLRSLYYLTDSDDSWINTGILKEDKLHLLVGKLQTKELVFDKEAVQRVNEIFGKKYVRPVYFIAPIRSELKSSYINWDKAVAELRNEVDTLVDLSDIFVETDYFADLLHTNDKAVDRIHHEIWSVFDK